MSGMERLNWHRTPAADRLQAKKLELIKAGRKVYDLGMINPNLEPPRFLIDRLQEAVAKKLAHRYSVAKGVLKLREALITRYAQKFATQLDAEKNCCICAGAKDALVQSLFVLEDRCDYLLLPAPTYPSFLAAGVLLSKPCFFYELSDDSNQLLENIKSAVPVTGQGVLILNFPNNPTGIAVDRSFYQALASYCENLPKQLTVINDFAYGELAFNSSAAISMLSVPYFKNHGLEIYSMSKSFSVPGWRIGAVLGNSELVDRIAHLKAQTDFGLFLPIQWAAAAALIAPDDFSQIAASEYANRFSLVADLLSGAGFEVAPASAGCSLWAKLPETIEKNAGDYCLELLEQRAVLLMPGEVFGAQYNQWLRVALVAGQPELQTALNNL